MINNGNSAPGRPEPEKLLIQPGATFHLTFDGRNRYTLIPTPPHATKANFAGGARGAGPLVVSTVQRARGTPPFPVVIQDARRLCSPDGKKSENFFRQPCNCEREISVWGVGLVVVAVALFLVVNLIHQNYVQGFVNPTGDFSQ